jgi:hypothetical protein
MPRWFLSTRAHSVGGPVGSVKILDADRPGCPFDLTQELVAAVQGRDVFFAVHGYNVNQADGIAHLGYWLDNAQIGNAVPIGILWPGDCVIPIFVDYVVEGHEAIASGKELAEFLNDLFVVATSLSFASHSLGARVALQTISGLDPGLRVRSAVLMAGAVDNDCLTNEYKAAAGKIEQISILASRRDDVLKLAYPLGNPIQGIIDRFHPYYHAALGREGPASPYPPPPRLRPNWQIPDNLDYGHLDYMPGSPLGAAFTLPVDIPPPGDPCPPTGTPGAFQGTAWKPAWSAGFVSTRIE